MKYLIAVLLALFLTFAGAGVALAGGGNSHSDPDGYSNGGVDKPDGNNGSGNDADCEDDNKGKGVPGHCKPKPTSKPTYTHTPKPTKTYTHTPKPTVTKTTTVTPTTGGDGPTPTLTSEKVPTLDVLVPAENTNRLATTGAAAKTLIFVVVLLAFIGGFMWFASRLDNS